MSQPDPLDVAIAAALAGGRILRRGFGQVQQVSHKGLVDLVTARDRESEAAILQVIHGAFPEHAILAEESGASQSTAADHRWVVDPLDGTTNYAHGYPTVDVSIAYERDGKLEVGVVYDPLRRELFFAQRGKGAFLLAGVSAVGRGPGLTPSPSPSEMERGDDGTPLHLRWRGAGGEARPLHVTTTASLIESLLETGFPYDRERLPLAVAQLGRLAPLTQGIRRAGAAALALAYVAAGRLDGFWEATLSPWDWAAGALLIEEAGGQVSRISGAPATFAAPDVLASNGKIHGKLVEALEEVGG
jgi:myo-inositol-1(or 4)-monophosphatase